LANDEVIAIFLRLNCSELEIVTKNASHLKLPAGKK
jgi:hypothetical protein